MQESGSSEDTEPLLSITQPRNATLRSIGQLWDAVHTQRCPYTRVRNASSNTEQLTVDIAPEVILSSPSGHCPNEIR